MWIWWDGTDDWWRKTDEMIRSKQWMRQRGKKEGQKWRKDQVPYQ